LLNSIQIYCNNIKRLEYKIQAFVNGTLDISRIKRQASDLEHRFIGNNRPTLFGTLVGVKDIIHVDGFETKCGSQLPASQLTGAESPIVTKLKDAGAIIAGKTVTVEFEGADPVPTCNPWNTDYTAGGSSAGSAAGVAAGFFNLALGAQTGGSVIRPAAYCGVVGFKPSAGRLSNNGVFVYSPTIEQLGLFARDVESIEQAMTIIDDQWQGDVDCPNPHLAIPCGPYIDIPNKEAMNQFYNVINFCGFNIFEHKVLGDINEQINNLDQLINAEAYRVHKTLFNNYRELYGPWIRQVLEEASKITDKKLELLQQIVETKRKEMHDCMDKLGVDFWLTPAATGTAPYGFKSTGDHSMNAPWTLAGLPVITIPSGRNKHNLPYGLQIVGRFNQDEMLISFSKKIYQILKDEFSTVKVQHKN